MKTLGLIGGTSWISTIEYYRIIHQTVQKKMGGLHSAPLFLYSVNFEEFKKCIDANDWQEIEHILCVAARKLESAGAECVVICANTPHKAADTVRRAVHIPLLHIAEITAEAIRDQGMQKVGLLGTKFTMEEHFFKDKLSQQHIETLIPDTDDREFIHASIFNELGKGICTQETKATYIGIIKKLIDQGAEGIIFGCTEIPLLIKQEDISVPIFDTMVLHATFAAEFAIKV